MVQCWAACLGDCDNVQSQEHYFTRGLFTSNSITLSGGFKWLRGETKTIGLSRFTSGILCGVHNPRLSALDSEAIKAFNTLERISKLEDIRSALKPERI